jgi:hypothetical protein
LWGPENDLLPEVVASNQLACWPVKSGKVACRQMYPQRAIFGRSVVSRTLALVACAALLYFAAGGSLFHHHTSGPDNTCHICQALHLPVLAAAPLDLVSTPELVTWFSSLPQDAAPRNSFSLHRAGRAPPTP